MATQSNIIADLSTLTRVPLKVFSDLTLKTELCIGSAIHDALLAGEEAVVLNLGYGLLSIELATKQCKFIPSKELKTIIRKSIDEKLDPVESTLEQDIIDKLLKVYSEEL